MKRHPLELLLPTRGARMVAALVFAGGTVWLGWVMQRIVRGITPGILAFEFAGTPSNAARILGQWGVSGEARMLAQIGLDNWFLVFYSTTIALLCVMIAIRVRPYSVRWADYGVLLGWAAWAAALLDRVENYALVQIIDGSRSALITGLAFGCAAVKFLTLFICLLYIVCSPIIFSRARHKLPTSDA